MLVGAQPARTPGADRTAIGQSDGSTSFIGANYEYFTVTRWWLEITYGNCLFGFRACYHSNLKGFENRALSCPLSE
jgi:hypothetical protein